jgi:aryl-alcohol dehydrogenase-like predicted oxidoreductase
MDESLSAMDDLVRSGKVRYIGVSNHPAWKIARAIGRSELLGLVRFVSVQPRYSLLFRQMERDMFPMCAEEGLAVIPYNPLAGGLLTGKHTYDASPPEGTRFQLGTVAGNYQDR